MPIIEALPLSDREAQALFRSLIDYRKTLQLSALYDSSLVREELAIVDRVSERISLNHFYPSDADYHQDSFGGDGE